MKRVDAKPGSYHAEVWRWRRALLAHYLAAHHGNRTNAARALDLQRTYFVRLLRECGISGCVADPSKARFAAKNRHILDALKVEQKRREASPPAAGTAGNDGAESHEKGRAGSEGSAPTGIAASSPDAPTTRGGKVATLWTMLLDATKADQRLAGALLREMTNTAFGKEIGSMSDLTEPQLDTLLTVPAEVMARTAGAIGGKK